MATWPLPCVEARLPSTWRPRESDLKWAQDVVAQQSTAPSDEGVDDDSRCPVTAQQTIVSDSRRPSKGRDSTASSESPSWQYDLFLSHLQRNAQDAVIAMTMFLKEARPGVRIFVDVDVEMADGLHDTIRKAVQGCAAFVFFITDGVLESAWCLQELRWAVEYDKNIVLVRETDPRHGGMYMKEFFKQVPPDLQPLFKNNIAVPWYRERGFRSVSVQTILRRAHLKDAQMDDLAKLSKTKRELESIFALEECPTTCLDIIQHGSIILGAVVFMGGYAHFRRPWIQNLYNIVFNVCFWTCGCLCAINILYKQVPYHAVAPDLLTVYLHLPAWQSWVVWRRFIRSPTCEELLAKVYADPDRRARLNNGLRVGGWVVLLIQLIMVANTLAGFAMPGTWVHMQDLEAEAGVNIYGMMHAAAMWVLFPPVIAVMFTSNVMFVFTAMLHCLDIDGAKYSLSQCVQPLAGYYQDRTHDAACAHAHGHGCYSSEQDAELGEGSSVSGIDTMEAWQKLHRETALEESLFKTVAGLTETLVDGVQQRIDNTCHFVGGLWLHLILYSACRVLVVSVVLVKEATQESHRGYRWWFICQDVFHLMGGALVGSLALFAFVSVTVSFTAVPQYARALLGEAGCPVARRASIVGLLGSRRLGMHVLRGWLPVDGRTAFVILFVLGVVGVEKAVRLLDIIDEPV